MAISHLSYLIILPVFFKFSKICRVLEFSLFWPLCVSLQTEIDQIEVIIPSLIKAHKLFDLGAVRIKVLVNMVKSYFFYHTLFLGHFFNEGMLGARSF